MPITTTTRPDNVAGTEAPAGRLSSLWRAAMAPAGVALLGAAAVFVLATGLGGDVMARQGTAELEPVLLTHVLGSTVLGSSAAVLLAWATRRFSTRPRRTFVITAAIGTVLYSTMPIIATEDLRSATVLIALHVVVALPLVLGIRGSLAEQR